MNNKEPLPNKPDTTLDARATFDIDIDMKVPAFSTPNPFTPQVDESYLFHKETTLAVLAGFIHNRRVMLQGTHGTGKSTHIEQIAARLNWACLRINLDSHISRLDLLGKDAIVLEDGKQITKYQDGILPWSLKNPVALCFDEYDAGRPDVMFVIQRILEVDGKLTLMDQNRVITPHPYFRLFATANTVGLGDTFGLYPGTQPLNQGQMDRWHIVSVLEFLPLEQEISIVGGKLPAGSKVKRKDLEKMVRLAQLTRQSFQNRDISTLMSPRTVLTWAQNESIFKNLNTSFRLSFFNRCEVSEQAIIAELYQRCFGEDLLAEPTATQNVS